MILDAHHRLQLGHIEKYVKNKFPTASASEIKAESERLFLAAKGFDVSEIKVLENAIIG
jgi:hypothetical protein